MRTGTSRRRRLVLLAAVASAHVSGGTLDATSSSVPPAPGPPAITLIPVTEVASPVDLAWRVDDSALYIVGRHGQVVRVDDDDRSVVLDIDDITNSEGTRGLLGLAFSPDGAKAYVSYNDVDGATNIAEVTVGSDGSMDRESLRVLMTVDQPYGDHNGGDLAFGPDGMLYVGLGDGGADGDPDRRAQHLGDLLGKLLRLDPRPSGDLGYTVPADNPFVGVQGARGEIWSVGLRNPWRFSFDPDTGDLWLTDVGQGRFEEINVAPALDGLGAGRGGNFGWSAFEGSEPFNTDVTAENHSSPIFEYDHSAGRCAIAGGVRARGAGAGPLAGWYVFADYCTGQIMALAVTDEPSGLSVAPTAVVLGTPGDPVSAIAAGPDGAVYVLSLGNVVFRIAQSLYRG
jgi:glucose/arabinose dehydrogenase